MYKYDYGHSKVRINENLDPRPKNFLLYVSMKIQPVFLKLIGIMLLLVGWPVNESIHQYFIRLTSLR